MEEFWYDYLKSKYCEKSILSYMDTDSFIGHLKSDDIYKDIAEDVAMRFDTSNYELNRQLSKRKKRNSVNER